jgi:sn-glycerol 3-phosphate transport system permease protein
MVQTSVKRRHRKAYRMNRTVKKVLSIFGRCLICLIFAFPFYWMIITSLKTYQESIQNPPTLWPQVFDLSGYVTVLTKMNLGMYFKNSIIIIIAVMAIQMVVMVPASYAFAKYDFKGKNLMFAMVLVANMTPTVITFIPIYIMFAKMNIGGRKILTTLWPQILPFGANAFGIFLLRQSFMQIPEEIIEAARLDNTSEKGIMFKIMLPMSKATMATIALFSFVANWNAYFWPLVMCRTEEVKPIILAIASLKELEVGLIWPTIMAGNTLVVLPILILFAIASKKIIASMAYRGVK